MSPAGEGPHPAAVVLSGCDGVHDNMIFWADALVRRGRAVLIVDSHSPRRLGRDPAWRLVCVGLAMPGTERAGDVAVALDVLARTPGVDGTDIVVLGASHGGWAAMEFVALAGKDRPPPGWPHGQRRPASCDGAFPRCCCSTPIAGL